VGVRGSPDRQLAMLTTLSTEDLIPADHPIRRIRVVVDQVLGELDATFTEMYATTGRPSVPPETLLKASVLMAMYSIRSERAFCERLNYDLLFKWFLDLRIDDRAFDASTFSKNRQRLLDHAVADEFFAAVVRQAKLRRYTSSDHFSVDGTLLKAWASHKSFKPKDPPPPPSDPPTDAQGRNAEVGWHGQKRSNDTHQLHHRPGVPPLPQEQQHRRHLVLLGASADGEPQRADRRRRAHHRRRVRRAGHRLGHAGPAARLETSPHRRRGQGLRHPRVRHRRPDARLHPHVAQNPRSAIDARTTRHPGHTVSMRIRKRIEEPFGFKINTAVYNLIRITALDTATA
jgi:transposase